MRWRYGSGWFASAEPNTSSEACRRSARQRDKGLEHQIHPLERVDLAEVREAPARLAARELARRQPWQFAHAVLEHVDALRGQSPRRVAFGQETARGDEGIDQCEMRLQVALAQEHVLGRDIGKTLRAGERTVALAQPAVGLDHLARVAADREVLVQRQHDARARAGASHGADHLDAEEQVVVEVHHVRIDCAQQRGEVAAVAECHRRAELLDAGIARDQELALTDRAHRGTQVQHRMRGACDEPRLVFRLRLDGTPQVPGGDLGAALGELDDQAITATRMAGPPCADRR